MTDRLSRILTHSSYQTSAKVLIQSTPVEGSWTVRSAGVDIRDDIASPHGRVYGVPWCELCRAHWPPKCHFMFVARPRINEGDVATPIKHLLSR